MPVTIDAATPPKNLHDLFRDAQDELSVFDSALFVRRAVSRVRALELSNILLRSWAPLISQIDQALSPAHAQQRKAELERLDRRAWVFYAADLAAEEQRLDTSRKHRRELAVRVAEHDRFLFKWAVPLFGDAHEDTLRDISRGTGARDDAEDVLRLVALFRENWDEVAARQQIVTEAYLEAASADAAMQLDLLRNGQSNPARALADAAYSLWYVDYDELMQLGRYLSRREADLTARFPGVREPATQTAAVEEVDEVDDAAAQEQEPEPKPDAEA